MNRPNTHAHDGWQDFVYAGSGVLKRTGPVKQTCLSNLVGLAPNGELLPASMSRANAKEMSVRMSLQERHLKKLKNDISGACGQSVQNPETNAKGLLHAICVGCGKRFPASRASARFCGASCRGKYYRKNKPKR